MPRTPLTITLVTRAAAGVAQPTQQNSDVSNGNVLAYNDGRIFFELQNVNAASRTVTVAQPTAQDGVASAGKVITVPLTSTVVSGPWPTAIYNQADGTVNVDCQGVAGDIKFRTYQLS